MSIFTVAPVTWTNDTPVPNAATFNLEIKNKMTDIDNHLSPVTFINVITFTNSWVNYGVGYRVAGYCKDSFGFVHLQGLIKSGIDGLSAFILPAEYRPSVEVYLASASATRIGTLIVGTDGTVAPQGEYSSTWFTLDGLLFYVG